MMTAPRTFVDNHGRPIEYLRLAVTDRCNLRCFYCMPEEGIHYLPKKELLTYEEMLRITCVLTRFGVKKVRLTGGEPFVRKELMSFIKRLNEVPGVEGIHLTTNGVLTLPHVKDFKRYGVKSVNLSLDSLDRQRFHQITRRDELPNVLETFEALLAEGIETKVNAVVMDGQNTQDIVPLAMLAKDKKVEVRFIEEMPFNGEGSHYPVLVWTYKKILDELSKAFPSISRRNDEVSSTSSTFDIEGFEGTVGIIAAFSRTFCGACNRIRITAQGTLKTCLYDDGVLDIRQVMRSGGTDQDLEELFVKAFSSRPKDGFEAEKMRTKGHTVSESMSTIGG
jgi:molybdenum cofactor biosynthesis protein A